MLKSRNLLIAASLLIALSAGAFFLYRQSHQAPKAARLLPESDLLFYANLKPVHLLNLKKVSPAEMAGEYKDFVDQTGIEFERDLDEVAMARRDTPDGRDVESSEIVVAKFDQARLRNYLQKLSSANEQYRNHTVYSISHEGHLVRVALLEAGKVAITNMASPEPMHGIIDRTFRPSDGPALLNSHYRDVPLGSLAWLIDRIPNKPDAVQLPGGLSFSVPADSVAVASLRYAGSLLFRTDVFAQSQAQAKEIVDSANSHLALVRSIGAWMGKKGPDQDVKAAFESIKIEQKENVAVFTATIPEKILRKIWSDVQSEGPIPGANPTQH